jgi:hypothetical protein
MYTYLIKDKKYLYPIHELIMGSGKTTVITPFICISLLNYIIQNKLYNNSIYVIVPNFLINQSYEILLKYVFPLFLNIEIIVNNNKPLFNNSVKIYLIDDIEYKSMFLQPTKVGTETSRQSLDVLQLTKTLQSTEVTKDITDTSNKYMIYDEVDFMANPLTNELNIQLDNKKEISNIPILYQTINLIYNNIFDSTFFWENIKHKKNNNIHNYIYSMDETEKNYISSFFKKLISDSSIQINESQEYIIENIIYFILTSQINYDYGMPETYDDIIINNDYKFKAIPYVAVDTPSMGSEFSDPILVYFLTFIIYKIFLKTDKLRKIDKIFIANYLEKTINNDSNHIFIPELIKMFSNIPDSINFINNYKSNQKYTFLDRRHFEFILN